MEPIGLQKLVAAFVTPPAEDVEARVGAATKRLRGPDEGVASHVTSRRSAIYRPSIAPDGASSSIQGGGAADASTSAAQ
tara:strand:- start:478 stop:714 length:237 start_codon:yes stop_codon:yes gene_type:complete